MQTKFDVAQWLTSRSTEADFLSMLEANSPEEALNLATARCTDAKGNFSEMLFQKFKGDYLNHCRACWGLPPTTGVL